MDKSNIHPVLESAQFIAEHSKHVHIDPDAVRPAAELVGTSELQNQLLLLAHIPSILATQ
jgi:hypothetical protein